MSDKKSEKSETSVLTAVVICPPKGEALWNRIQLVRSKMDKAFDRWMPHICLMYPFVLPEEIPAALSKLSSALEKDAKERLPLEVTFGEKPLNAFVRGSKAPSTIYLDPKSHNNGLAKLQSTLMSAFPHHTRGKFHPHLTVGQCLAVQVPSSINEPKGNLAKSDMGVLYRTAKDEKWSIKTCHVIQRTKDTPFEIVATLDLQTGAVLSSDKEVEVEVDDEGRDAGGLDEVDFKWREGNDPRDKWVITDQEQLLTIELPDPNKMPCEARLETICAFLKRGMIITKLSWAWWLSFNIQMADKVTDYITIEEAIDIGVQVQSPEIIMLLAEYSTEDQMGKRKPNILKWYTDTAKLTENHHPSLKRAAALLGQTLVEMGWIKEQDLDKNNGPGAVPKYLLAPQDEKL